jgi:hypothetical protein
VQWIGEQLGAMSSGHLIASHWIFSVMSFSECFY